MNTKQRITVVFILLFSFVVSGCGNSSPTPAAGTIQGMIKFSFLNATSSPSIHPCLLSEYSPGAPVNEASVDSSGVFSQGWSDTEGWSGTQGDLRAPGFVCTLNPDLKFNFEGTLEAGSETAFTILNVPAGKYSLAVAYDKTFGRVIGLVYGENSVPVVIDLTADHGIDTGTLTIDYK